MVVLQDSFFLVVLAQESFSEMWLVMTGVDEELMIRYKETLRAIVSVSAQ